MRRIGVWLGLCLACAWSAAPILWQIATSLKTQGELEMLPPLLPTAITSQHYHAIFAGYPFARVLANSAIVAGGTTLLAVALGTLAGFGLAKLRPNGRAGILATVVVLSMLPPIATVSPLFVLVNALGMRDTLAAHRLRPAARGLAHDPVLPRHTR
jgi:multiple sugar transport system permease protein